MLASAVCCVPQKAYEAQRFLGIQNQRHCFRILSSHCGRESLVRSLFSSANSISGIVSSAMWPCKEGSLLLSTLCNRENWVERMETLGFSKRLVAHSQTKAVGCLWITKQPRRGTCSRFPVEHRQLVEGLVRLLSLPPIANTSPFSTTAISTTRSHELGPKNAAGFLKRYQHLRFLLILQWFLRKPTLCLWLLGRISG